MGNSAEILSGSVGTLNQDERLRVLKKIIPLQDQAMGVDGAGRFPECRN